MNSRKQEITNSYFKLMNEHLNDIKHNRIDKVLRLKDIADKLHIHPRHLSNTVKSVTGKSPCYFFENKLIEITKLLLEDNEYSITKIAQKLDYDPSNFTKFFKNYTGQTPTQYRKSLHGKN